MRYLHLFLAFFFAATVAAQTQYVVVHSDGANVYQKPDKNSSVVLKLCFKSLLEVHDINSKWAKIYKNNQWGYVPTRLIKKNISRENSFDGLSHRQWEPINKKDKKRVVAPKTDDATNYSIKNLLLEVESPNTAASSDSIAVDILSIYVKHNQMINGEKSLEIHLKFDVFNAKFENCEAIALFYRDNGEPITDNNGRYENLHNQVSSIRRFSPRYARSRYNDFQITIPNSELHATNNSDINFVVEFRIKGQHIGTSWRYRFVVTDYLY